MKMVYSNANKKFWVKSYLAAYEIKLRWSVVCLHSFYTLWYLHYWIEFLTQNERKATYLYFI